MDWNNSEENRGRKREWRTRSLKNQKTLAVKLKDKYGNYLVACDDRKSIKGTENPTPPETAQWIIKGKDPEKRVRLVSIYGKYLAADGVSDSVIQTDKDRDDLNIWWKLEETEKGFPKVYLRPSQQYLNYYLMSNYDGKVEWDYLNNKLERWLLKGLCRWEVIVLNDPKPFIVIEEERSIPGSITQINNYNGCRGDISNVINSGKNVNNGPGNQFNGGINIRTQHRGRVGQQNNYNGGPGEISNVNSGKIVRPGNQFNGGTNIRTEYSDRIVNIINKI